MDTDSTATSEAGTLAELLARARTAVGVIDSEMTKLKPSKQVMARAAVELAHVVSELVTEFMVLFAQVQALSEAVDLAADASYR